MRTTWPAPQVDAPIHALVELPGSKSETNRALIIAALSQQPSVIRGGLIARDTSLMMVALEGLGVGIDAAEGGWRIVPGPMGAASVDVGLAGTIMRFLPPVAALAHGVVHFDGDPYARTRPMRPLLDGLRQAGVRIDDDALPFDVVGTGEVAGGKVQIDAGGSSQFVSGLLLSAARFTHGLELRHTGSSPVPSLPHIEMTLGTLRAAGVDAQTVGSGHWLVAPGPVQAPDVRIEPDLSNAAPFLAAAMLTGGSVSVPHWPAQTTQAGDLLRQLLPAMGGSLTLKAGTLTVNAGARLHGIDVDLSAASELATILAVLAALADSPSKLKGLAHTRGHETDRLAALRTELNALGGDVSEDDDGLTIRPRPLHGGIWHAYADHRMATAGALLGLAVPGVEIDDIDCTAKTLPQFTALWGSMTGAE